MNLNSINCKQASAKNSSVAVSGDTCAHTHVNDINLFGWLGRKDSSPVICFTTYLYGACPKVCVK